MQIQNSDIRQWATEEPFDEDFAHYPSAMSFVASGSWTLEELSEERRSLDPSPTAKIDGTIDYDYLAVNQFNSAYDMNPPKCDLAPSSKSTIDFGIHFSGLRSSRVLS